MNCRYCGHQQNGIPDPYLDNPPEEQFIDGLCEQCWNFCCRECGAFLHASREFFKDNRKCMKCGALYIWNYDLESWGLPVAFSDNVPAVNADAVMFFTTPESIGICRNCDSWYVKNENDESGCCGLCELNMLGVPNSNVGMDDKKTKKDLGSSPSLKTSTTQQDFELRELNKLSGMEPVAVSLPYPIRKEMSR